MGGFAIKIALLDLNHVTRGVHNNTVPLGLGMIRRYVQTVVDDPVDIRIFKDAERALEAFLSWTPDIAGIAQYAWNSELNLCMAEWIKKQNPKCVVVAGGPNLDSANDSRIAFFQRAPWVDVCIAYDGEIPFASLVQRLLKGQSLEAIKMDPPAGVFAYDQDRHVIMERKEDPAPRLASLDAVGALYAEGGFDDFLIDGYHPFLQTHRGCPFTCAFCHTGDQYYSKMIFLSPEIFRNEMEYLGKRFAGRHDVTLYLANTNMSLFVEDFAIARIIRATQDRYDWPRHINVNSGKDPKKLLEMLSIIRFQPAIALQTLTPAVLKAVNRANLPLSDFMAFQQEVLRRTGSMSATELILCLPGETKESFLETVRKVLNSGVQNVVIYTLMSLNGTPLASKGFKRKFGYDVRHRVVPRQFSIMKGRKVLDTEEVVVATNTMSFEEYIELRCLSFTITVFHGSVELVPLKRVLVEYGVDVARWVFSAHGRLSEFPDIDRLYQDYVQETKSELFPTREALIAFFEQEENWRALCGGAYGDNLLRKYKQRILTHAYKSIVELGISEAQPLLGAVVGEMASAAMLEDMRRYLKTRDVKDIFGELSRAGESRVRLDFDIPLWLGLSDGKRRLGDFYNPKTYVVTFGRRPSETAKDFIRMNKDAELSLQMLYRDGNISDFWPVWSWEGN